MSARKGMNLKQVQTNADRLRNMSEAEQEETMKKAIYIKEHQCINCLDFICVEKYSINGIDRWYFNISGKLNGIKYCPYCGKNLYEEED